MDPSYKRTPYIPFHSSAPEDVPVRRKTIAVERNHISRIPPLFVFSYHLFDQRPGLTSLLGVTTLLELSLNHRLHLLELAVEEHNHAHDRINDHRQPDEAETDRILRGHRLRLVGDKACSAHNLQRQERSKTGADLDAERRADSRQEARGVVRGIIASGRKVPEDVAVIGHDNWTVFSTDSHPTLTTFDNNIPLIGKTAAHMLIDAINGKVQHGVTLVECPIMVRETTEGA
ncbi:MAG: substrate-binding domain-containing protein [Bifidobacteriaceae bacterium]|jgi:hypothetical protein|nr:substrate-binding domain-containing protein [Bifidobacteriaceae bacterium]MCI1914697.1 substrate-binding domain-containing protein [Bifidobacteriaceae bacterium]MCI1979681.1 substrate-binding domain-containing protein [Bifidobacteriaceae bacterium]